jgi:hypothetical protein
MRYSVSVIALAVACGPSAPTGSGAGSSGSPGTDAGTTTGGSDAGAANGPDAGTASGDAGTNGGAGSDAGTSGGSGGSPDGGGGGGSGGGPGGSDGGGGAGGGADGGTVASDCDALRFPADPGPAPASHFIRVADSSGNDSCFAVGTTGTGTLALEMLAEMSTLDFVGASGDLLASLKTVGSTDFFGEQAVFFDNMQISTTHDLRMFTDTGREQPQERNDISLLAEDPTGGAVGLASTSPCTIVSLDESLRMRWTAQCPSGSPRVALAVDRSGATLYVYEGSKAFGANSMGAMWVDPHGNAGETFELVGPQAQSVFTKSVTLAQRVGSGFFVQNGANWIDQIDSLSTTPSPAPAWLEARPNTSLHMVHGGTGYAVLPAASAVCAQDVEILSPAGTSCGATRFTAASSACSVQSAIIVGYDGTVIQRAPDPDPTHQEWFGPGTCYWHWWPGFFR